MQDERVRSRYIGAPLTKMNYSKIQFTKGYFTSKLWYYGQNYGTIPRTMELLKTRLDL